MAEPLPQLPADFFDKNPPDELPHDFFEKQTTGSTPAAPKKKLTAVEKTRNLLMGPLDSSGHDTRPSTEGPGHFDPEDPSRKFEFPPWLQAAGTAAMVAEGGVGAYQLGKGLLKSAAARGAAESLPDAPAWLEHVPILGKWARRYKFLKGLVPKGEPVPEDTGPFRPNPNIARQMRYGGPAEEGASGVARPKLVGRAVKGGSLVPEEPTAEPPFKDVERKGKLGKLKLRYTPGSTESAGGTRGPALVGGNLERKLAAERAASKAEEVIKKTTGTESGVTPAGKFKLRGDIFSNVDDLAKKAGVSPTVLKKQFRDAVEKIHGKRISEMNEEELMQVANGVQDLIQK